VKRASRASDAQKKLAPEREPEVKPTNTRDK